MAGHTLDGRSKPARNIPKRSPHRPDVPRRATTPYPKAVRQAILDVSNCECHTGQISRLNFLLLELYAKALRDLCVREKIPLDSIQLVGCHGQTIFHQDTPTEVAKHRVASTLVPFADLALFRHKKRGRVALNIGESICPSVIGDATSRTIQRVVAAIGN